MGKKSSTSGERTFTSVIDRITNSQWTCGVWGPRSGNPVLEHMSNSWSVRLHARTPRITIQPLFLKCSWILWRSVTSQGRYFYRCNKVESVCFFVFLKRARVSSSEAWNGTRRRSGSDVFESQPSISGDRELPFRASHITAWWISSFPWERFATCWLLVVITWLTPFHVRLPRLPVMGNTHWKKSRVTQVSEVKNVFLKKIKVHIWVM